MTNYGYVNPCGQEAIRNEIIHRVKAYFELKGMMKQCRNLILYAELSRLAKEMRGENA